MTREAPKVIKVVLTGAPSSHTFTFRDFNALEDLSDAAKVKCLGTEPDTFELHDASAEL